MLAPFIAPELEAVITRCLRTAPDERYASATELRAALVAVRDEQDDEPAAIPTDGRRWLSPLVLVAAAAIAGAASHLFTLG